MKQPLDYEAPPDRDIDEYFIREVRAVRRQMWAALVVIAAAGVVWVVLV